MPWYYGWIFVSEDVWTEPDRRWSYWSDDDWSDDDWSDYYDYNTWWEHEPKEQLVQRSRSNLKLVKCR
ncbi:unnamed protein product, partial [Symbiodinium microadriaticum]